jgi:NAD(P)-dependent dehydrogenase (short-subunit alcohol dehydrogenase family)
MDLREKVCIVTGGASGIGRALCLRFAREGAHVVVSDRDAAGAERVAQQCGGRAVQADVSREQPIAALVQAALDAHGRLDLFASNAGIAVGGGPEAPDADWQRAWDINVMAHVWAARHALPPMLARGQGYLLQTASAAGLLTSLGAAPYAASKHAAVAFAEWLSITYADRGIRVSCLCPQGVNTPLLDESKRHLAGRAVVAAGRVLEPDDVADAVVAGLRDERFLILPHPEVLTYLQRRAGDEERWLQAMRSLQRKVE